jgi:hypothetical protein
VNAVTLGPGPRYAHNCSLVTFDQKPLLILFGGSGAQDNVLSDLYALDIGMCTRCAMRTRVTDLLLLHMTAIDLQLETLQWCEWRMGEASLPRGKGMSSMPSGVVLCWCRVASY